MGNQTIKLSPIHNEHKATTVLRKVISGMSTRDVIMTTQEADILPQDCHVPKEPWTNWGRQYWLEMFDANIKSARVSEEKEDGRTIGFTHVYRGGNTCESEYQGVRIPTDLVPTLAADFNAAL